MKSKKKAPVILDFSNPVEVPEVTEFEVEDYDYVHRQGPKVTAFEQDLEFLLSDRESKSQTDVGAEKKQKEANPAPESIPLKAETRDLMSQPDRANSAKISDLGARFSGLDIGPGQTPKEADNKLGAERVNCRKQKPKTGKTTKEVHRISRREITNDLDGIDFSTDDEMQAPPKKQTGPVQSEGSAGFEDFEELEKSAILPTRKSEKKAKKRNDNNKDSDVVGLPGHENSSRSVSVEPDSNTTPSKTPKKKQKARKNKTSIDSTNSKDFQERENSGKQTKSMSPAKKESSSKLNLALIKSDSEPVQTASPKSCQDDRSGSNKITLPCTSQENSSDSNAESPSSSTAKNASVPKTADPASSKPADTTPFPRLSSAKAVSIKQLPEVQPVSTIFGLSHEQIFKTKLTDVKVKTIVNVPMSKMCKNALTFVMAENEGLFRNEKKRSQFVDLCFKVALYEAPGFNEVTKRIPELLEWVPQYEPLTLPHTKTNLTVSNKQIHKNSLDYTVFAFFGHILLWANELQHAAKLTTIIEKYRLEISRNQISNSLGGHHLWDRLRRDKTINTKRWKHIQKFRQLFAFEEHQFVLILRCMNLGVPVC